ncbi:alanine--tRNA ligase [Candidatus Saccharibacteria bacterium]|nr:alanine--tRNA ligase [Candidatus Saccharibacteria bacterium]
MKARDIRNTYLSFMKDRGHSIIPRSNIVPLEDPTTLFTGSGMQPMVPYLLGESHPDGHRLADSQTCFRAEDIEEIGDNRHTTFFEMLGNWSLGDYFKQEQIRWMWEFLVQVLKLDPQRLYFTAFIGDEEHRLPKDTESAELWQELLKLEGIDASIVELGSEAEGARQGMQGGRIFLYDASKNWWSRAGKPGSMPVGEPGGPCTEMFYELVQVEHDTSYGTHCHPNCDCGRFIEIGNNVLMEYIKTDQGFEPLRHKNIDFGGGLERIAMAVNDTPDIFAIDMFQTIIDQISDITGQSYSENQHAMRVIADHIRGATFMAVDGVRPSNTAQGYVLRRIIRRAVRHGLALGVQSGLLSAIVPTVVALYAEDYPEVVEQAEAVIEALTQEEEQFRSTLERGLREFSKRTTELDFSAKPPVPTGRRLPLSGKLIFTLADTYGFPAELSIEEADKDGIEVEADWQTDYQRLLDEQKERSRTATAGQFKGGLADHSAKTIQYHTATHLMYRALRNVLGDHVMQRGSNITPERLRFDFSHHEKMTPGQIAEVERIVNDVIKRDLPISFTEMGKDDAFSAGALGAFGEKYPDIVKVYTVGDPSADWYSKEICGGPHISHTGELGVFKIVKEESSSAGVRRIKAVLE